MTKRPIQAEDLFRIFGVSDPRVSPDGQRVVFVVKRIDPEKNRYLSHLYLADLRTGEVRSFTAGEVSDRAPRWSPDGTRILFLRTRDQETQFWMIRADGGEAWPVTHLEEGTPGDPVWAPDGRRFAFTFRPTHPDWTRAARKRREEQRRSSPPRVITRLNYRTEGLGFLDIYQQIGVGDVETGAVRWITEGPFDHASPAWSPDGCWIAFIANRSDDPEGRPYEEDIWRVPPEGGEPQRLPSPPGYKQGLQWSPDGQWLAWIGIESREDPWMPYTPRLWALHVERGEVRCLTADLDRPVGNRILTDTREAFASALHPRWSVDGRFLYIPVSEGGSCHLYRVPLAGGAPEPVTAGELDIFDFDGGPGEQWVLAVSRPTAPGELFRGLPGRDGRLALQPLTALHREWLEEVALAAPEEITFSSLDGTVIQGWILRPPDFDPGQRYPLLLYIHGGPHAQYGHAFFHEFQFHAARGYVVFYTNPRGSTGYGEAFARAIQGDWGNLDAQDLLAAADFAARLPFVDAERMAVAGGSYGGYMVNWLIGRTDRFRCAITDRSVVNLHSFTGTSDYPFMPDGYWAGNAWERPERLWERSPLRHAADIRTPLLILHSEGDLRCPIGQAEELFAALRRLKREVVFVRYPPETGHGLSRTGPPDLRIDRLQRIAGWLDRWLRGSD
ncbi:S9 family peptidase [Thermoflexus hugenholtzii]